MEDYKNTKLDFKERAKDLVARMTLEEKVSQMVYTSPAIPRLGIPKYNWWNEALHGVARAGVATMFPQAIGLAATFDETILKKVGSMISDEGRAKHHEYVKRGDIDIYKGLTFWSPNVNIFRDPRWGRGHETFGEDPYLSGLLGVVFVKGIQGSDKKYMKAAACAKHFAVHSGPENLRHSFNAVVSKKDLRETYLPAFRDCVKKGNVEIIMGAYNRTNDEPCCGSKMLLTDILRKEWGFDGHVVSDCWAIKDFHMHHKITATAPESAALAVRNGCDLNCGNMFLNIQIAINEGLITDIEVDTAVERLFTTRMRLGMFDHPEDVSYTKIPFDVVDCKKHNDYAVEAARKSVTLLKNEEGLLPLNKKKLKSIAVIGPNADSRAALEGNYQGRASQYITVLDGIRLAVGKDVRVRYTEGCTLFRDRARHALTAKDGFSEALAMAELSDVVIMCMGLDGTIEGEEGDASNVYASGDKNDLNLPGIQQDLIEAISATGKPIVLVLMCGSALSVTWADEHIPAILNAWYPGGRGGIAVADAIFGKFSPAGRLPVTFYRTTEELPDFCDYSMKGRTYKYIETTPLYPFGYGLSYTKFQYSTIALSKDIVDVGDNVKCSVKVTNVGKMKSDEVVQLYLRDVETSTTAPHYQLFGIKRITLAPKQSKVVDFTIKSRDMALIDEEGNAVLEPGIFEVFIGPTQPDKRSFVLTGTTVQKASFTLVGACKQLKY